MNQETRSYLAIDLKSFYASVECVERQLNPLTTHLVVADLERTEKTICLAVSPSLKAYGIPGRARLFEVVQRVKEINARRRQQAPKHQFAGSSYDAKELEAHPELELAYLVAPPRMAYYMEYSTAVYRTYLKYIAPEDIHVYSIDEVFMDVTHYLKIYRMTPRELAGKIIRSVLEETGITATAGIGTNLYLCKVAMDIVAKHVTPDEKGLRIAELDEMSYRKLLWNHKPLTDFWRIGRGYRKKLEANGLFTMGDIARCSLGGPLEFHNENLLYKLFGINAELLIDHAWGFEPVTMAHIKAYRPSENSISSGQVLPCPYDFEKGKLIALEMTDALVLDLVEKGLVTDQLTLTVGYDMENLSDPELQKDFSGEISRDYYGRNVPKHAHGSVKLEHPASSARLILKELEQLYVRIVNPKLSVRRVMVAFGRLKEGQAAAKDAYEQMDLFTDYESAAREQEERDKALDKERRLQEAMLAVKKKYGKNAMLKGMNLREGATARERNQQIGGHKA